MQRSARLGRQMIAHLPALRRYALGLAGNGAAADDLVQDCIERALRRLDTLQSEDKMAPWLRSILFNVFVDGHRQLKSRGIVVDVDVLEGMGTMTGGQDVRHEANEVLTATAALSPQHRQVLLLIGVEGLSYREAADELGVPVGTIMSRVARARDQLREVLTRPSTVIPLPRREARS